MEVVARQHWQKQFYLLQEWQKDKAELEDGNTVSDFDKEEIARKVSIGASVIPTEWKNIKYNFLDTPGYFDFAGEMYGVLRCKRSSNILVDASAGEVGTEKAWQYTENIKFLKWYFWIKWRHMKRYWKSIRSIERKFWR